MGASYAAPGEPCQPALPPAVAACRACRRCPGVVPGSAVLDLPGGPRPVLFVGEAPGRLGAARSGRPFVGDVAGARFAALLAASGLDPSGVAVTNAVLCLPLDSRGRNRRPSAGEIRACASWLATAIDHVRPAVIVPLGTTALAALEQLRPHGARLRDAVARPRDWGGLVLFPLYHPGARAAIHRPLERQLDDWRTLGDFVRSLAAADIENSR